MKTLCHKSIRRLLPAVLSILLNAVLCLALLRLSVTTSPGETRIAVELQQVKEKNMTTALPPPPPRIMKLKQQAEQMIKKQEAQPKKAQPSILQIFKQQPVTLPTLPDITPEVKPEVKPEVNLPDNAPATNPTLPAPTPTIEAPATGTSGGGIPATTTAGNGTNNNTGAGTPGAGTAGMTGGQSGSQATPGGEGTGSGKTSGAGTTKPAGSGGNPDESAGSKTTPPPEAPKGISRKSAVKSHPQPAYPSEARDEGIQGTVRLRIAIDENGRVTGDPKVVKSSGSPVLDRAAQRGVRKWEFEPELADGNPVASTIIADIVFQLH